MSFKRTPEEEAAIAAYDKPPTLCPPGATSPEIRFRDRSRFTYGFGSALRTVHEALGPDLDSVKPRLADLMR